MSGYARAKATIARFLSNSNALPDKPLLSNFCFCLNLIKLLNEGHSGNLHFHYSYSKSLVSPAVIKIVRAHWIQCLCIATVFFMRLQHCLHYCASCTAKELVSLWLYVTQLTAFESIFSTTFFFFSFYSTDYLKPCFQRHMIGKVCSLMHGINNAANLSPQRLIT